jgi:glycosyltransferase involved in cell wall biosynthesis
MKLGMLIPEFPTQTHVFFWREIQGLRSVGVEVRLLSTRRPRETCPHAFAAPAAAETHYLHPPTPGALAWIARHPWRTAQASRYALSLGSPRERLRALAMIPSAAELARVADAEKIDHVHVHSCAAAAHVAAMARLLGGPPFSLHLHGDLPVYGTDHERKSALASFVAAAARPMQQQLIEQVGLPPERTCTLLMGVDTARFSAAAPTPEHAGPLRIVTVARLNLAKGHRVALEAIALLRTRGVDVRYHIVGSGPHRADVEADIRRLGLEDRAALVGALGEDAVAAELRDSDVFVLPTVGLGEASPVSVMEAMASGVCVVASRVGGLPDMITSGVDGHLFPARDVAALAAILERLAREPSERRAVAEAGRRRAVEQFDSRVQARRFLDVVTSSAAPSAELGAVLATRAAQRA